MSLLERLKGSKNAPVVKGGARRPAGGAPARQQTGRDVATLGGGSAPPGTVPPSKTQSASPAVAGAQGQASAPATQDPLGLKKALAPQQAEEKKLGGVAGRLLQKRKQEKKEEVFDPYRELREEVQERLVRQVDQEALSAVKNEEDRHAIVRNAISDILSKVVAEKQMSMTRQTQQRLVQELCDDVLGLGPLEPLLADPEVSEIMVNGPGKIYVIKEGKIVLSGQRFRDNQHVMNIIDRIVAPLGRRCDESSPIVDARLKDGSRVNVVIPPLALCGPTITIRKFSEDPLTMQDLINFGTLTEEVADFLAACVRIRLNIFISGGAGSGKTTTLNVLSSFIPDDERIITIEDAAELQLAQEHVVSLETRPPNIEGKGEITMRDLVKNCLRMRPERIIVGEVRSAEALDMLQAMNTGHDGSLATGHSNSPKDMISRLETMVMMAGMDLPAKAIRENIASAVDLIIQQNRLKDGSRKIVNVTEVQGIEGDEVILVDIFKFEQDGIDPSTGKILGELRPTGIKPKFYPKFFQEGIVLPEDIFERKG